MISTKSLHILCFGDSLTAGWSDSTSSLHPYEIALKSILRKAFPHMNITTDNQGLSGDQVTSPSGGFLPRMDTLYEKIHPTNPYTHAIILGGTNDLSQSRPSSQIYRALKAVWSIPLKHNTTVLAITIPESNQNPPVPISRRDNINNAILARGNQNRENFYTIDLHAKIPYWSMPKDERGEIWDDGVHFTAKGYDLMGSIFAERITELVKAEAEEGEIEIQEEETEFEMVGVKYE